MLLQYIVAFIILDYVNGDNTKGSLTFVIDDTASMTDDIEQVKEHTNQVFDAVLSANASKIDDFIIVTFNDPDVRLYTVTRDRDVFKKALAEIKVRGNLDCPEYAMKGIELALEKSKPNSFFYVFTDAAAKDYKEYDRIKSLGLKKSIQVTFLLTGECPNSLWEANAVYDKLAAATNGQVFHLAKKDIQKIMGYIIASVNYIKTTLAHKYFDNALNKKIQFSIDSKVWDVIISVSGVSPRYHITGPDGNKVEMKTFIDTEKSHISKLEVKPGIYTVHLDSVSAISTVITGSTSVSFQHGFATVQPNTLNETSTKPISGLPSYLSIALDNIDKDVSLDTIEIRDIDDNLISEFPLTLIDKNQQFYVTKPLLTPNSTFKLAINGHTATKEKITRVASTTIEPQRPELEGPKLKAPTVTILEGAKITGEYDKSMTLKCKVNAFPKPDIIWQDNLETVYSFTTVPVDLPYEYMSILKIDKINKNVTIQCKAVNLMGENSDHITVETKRNYFIKVLAFPKDTTIEYGAQAELNFRVKSFPQVKIIWYINGKQIKNNSDYKVSSDGLKVVIRQMRQELKGNYTVEAYNDEERKKHHFKIDISGVIPVIDKSIRDYKAEKGSNVNISCRILKSKPSPVISWTFKPEGFETSIRLKEETETLHLNNVGLKQIGTYTCLAHNEFGRDSHVVDLFVEYAPTIKKAITQVKVVKGQLVTLTCKVDGSPFPTVRWLFNKVEINNTGKYIYNANSLRFISSIEDNGIYTCEASNSVGKAEKRFYVTTFIIPVINKSISDYKAERGSNVNISCRILKSHPSPVISWTFKPEGLESSKRLKEVTETLHLKNVGLKQIGTYTCLAHNEFGRDSHVVDLFVEYAPTITKAITQVKVVKGQLVTLTCKVDGSPFPTVRWLFNKVEINNTGKYIYNDSSLRFISSIEDNGIYTCEASNSVGKAEKHFYVTTFIPLKIKIPKQSNFELDVGVSAELECLAEGYPKPNVQWIFYSENPRISPKHLGADSNGTLSLEHIQVEGEGFYTCFAKNDGESKSITYKINVTAPVSILANPLGATTYDAVQGDLALRIPCNAIGSPKPVVTWEIDGFNITSGTEWCDIEEDGTLIIKYPNLYSAGSYTCRASNHLGKDLKVFTVNVTPYLQLDNVRVTANLNLEIGTSQYVECDLPHRYGDIVNWFKDGQFITSGKLYLRNLTIQDTGVYSCRVSTFKSTHTLHKKVTVGCKPIFIRMEDTNIDLIKGTNAYLHCSAYGEPKPQIIWKHNGNFVKTSDMSYILETKPDDIGSYECVVSNKFGNINRTFNIQNTKECLLDIEKDFNKHQPLLLSRSQQWPDFKKLNNFIRIPISTHFLFSCPGNTVTYNKEEFGEYVEALCIDNSTFKIRDRNVDFSKIKCKKQIKSLVKNTNQSCFSGNTELLKVGFMLQRNILEVYEICLDKDNKIPLFTRHNLHQGISGTLPKENFPFTGSQYLRFRFDDMYKYKLQLQLIQTMTGKNLNNPNKCCFKKRQLVSPADVIPGLSQVATYNYLNVIPQWSTCGTENWDEIERRIRSLAMFSDINLSVFTGSSYPLTLPGQSAAVYLGDRFGRHQPVPMFIWKVVQNTYDKSSLAIIHLNIPNINLSQALSYMPCEDICDEVEWMKNYQWHDVDKGFTFCCSITEFTSYYGTLIKGHDNVFKSIP